MNYQISYICVILTSQEVFPQFYIQNIHWRIYSMIKTANSRYIQLPMDTEQQNLRISHLNDLTLKFCTLSLNSCSPPPQHRQANVLEAIDMAYQIHPGHVQQYNQLYLNRLAVLGKRIPFNKTHKIEKIEGQLGTINIIGIFKRIQVKRVRAFEKKFESYYASNKVIYDENDSLEIEDVTGKLRFVLAPGATLNGREVRSTDLPYGIVIGITGTYCEQKMQFNTKKVTLPSLPPQKSVIHHSYASPRKILIISSTNIKQLKTLLSLCCSKYCPIFFSQIKCIIIMGFRQKLLATNYQQLDQLFQKFLNSIDIFLMPNYNISESYPQIPIHPILFKNSYKGINLVNNPQLFYTNPNNTASDTIDSQPAGSSTSILICSGENIKDLAKNCSYGSSSLDTMQSILQYSHLAPTCPFSLKCEMMEEDYFILQELPHLFIAGECQATRVKDFVSSDSTKLVKLVSIRGGDAVLVDIDTHQVKEYVFGEQLRNVLNL